MIERHEIENDLLGEIAEHFTACGDEPSTYAGLVIEYARQQQGLVILRAYDRTSGAPFFVTARVQVLLGSTTPPAASRGTGLFWQLPWRRAGPAGDWAQ